MEIIQKPSEQKTAILSNPRNVRYASEDKSLIDMTIHHSEFGDIEFTASIGDTEEHGRALYEAVVSDQSIIIADYDYYYYFPNDPTNPANQIPVVGI